MTSLETLAPYHILQSTFAFRSYSYIISMQIFLTIYFIIQPNPQCNESHELACHAKNTTLQLFL